MDLDTADRICTAIDGMEDGLAVLRMAAEGLERDRPAPERSVRALWAAQDLLTGQVSALRRVVDGSGP